MADRRERMRSVVNRASRGRDRAERISSHAHRLGYWHRSISLETFAFGNGERLTNIVDAGDSHATKRHRSRAYGLPWFTPSTHVVEATTQRLIDQVLQGDTTATAQSFERRGNVIIKG